VIDSLRRLGLPAALAHSAGESVMAGVAVAGQLPVAVRGAAASAVRDAFMSGLSAGSVVAAVATALAAVGALALLPARHRVVLASPVALPARAVAAVD